MRYEDDERGTNNISNKYWLSEDQVQISVNINIYAWEGEIVEFSMILNDIEWRKYINMNEQLIGYLYIYKLNML